MAKAWILFCLICCAFAFSSWVPHRNLLEVAIAEIGVREATGHNDGLRVGEYQRAAACSKGDPWCACFVSWVFKQAGYVQPRTGWSPALFPPSRLVIKPKRGCVFGIYVASKKRIAHCGIIERVHGSRLYTIEGNTDIKGSSEGDGVYRKVRHLNRIKYFAEWRG
ncbi:CHAP domain-containing protein [Pedobacter sp. MC2016-14]|uniref:CHAP domain-containing protein n=1 Tax=Pedobacter sp. MC2016-14 TaxID=2897327 RepID=UPI001E455055|nr:CHAP domain-containing protein [Pedobacter sp. MC2016-14]MCD0489707.1 CHAP domain-containing protein [Pedobacter sp. MC2016-14]